MKGGMDQAFIKDGLRVVWGMANEWNASEKEYPSSRCIKISQTRINHLNIDVAMKARGMTSLLQRFDVAINKLFKDPVSSTVGWIGWPMHRKRRQRPGARRKLSGS